MDDTQKTDRAAESTAILDSENLKKTLIDQLRARGGTKSIDSKNLMQGLVQQTLQAFLELEMEEHLGYAKYDPDGRGSGNARNGSTPKTVRGDFGEVEIETPRDRNASFEPKIVAKRQTSIGNFNEKIASLYARGMSVREIEEHIREMYGVEISAQLSLALPINFTSKSSNGRIGRWKDSTPSFSWMACGSLFAPTKG